MTRFYANLNDLSSIAPLGFKDEAGAINCIRSASQFLEGKKQLNGNFIPIVATRYFDGEGSLNLFLRDYLLSITTITHDGDTLSSSDYVLYPRRRHWENGPYTRLAVDPDATGLAYWKEELDVVSIAGSFGKYTLTKDTEAVTTTGVGGDDDLFVDDGSLIAPGMILLIDSEQHAVIGTGSATAATSLVDGAIAAIDVVITVDDASEFNVGEVIKIGTEQLKIVDLDSSAENLYVTRAYNGTRAQAHADDSAISVYRTYKVERAVNGTTQASHNVGSAIYQYRPPFDVVWLCRQIAGLMIKKAESHFSGKIGDPDLGEVFYLNEFPKMQIAETRANYRITRL